MKWLKKWGYLILLIVVGLFYFSYVDQWKVYAKALAPVAEWYDEQSDKYEVLATVNDWFAGVLAEDVNVGNASDTQDNEEERAELDGTETGDSEQSGQSDDVEEVIGQDGVGDSTGDNQQAGTGITGGTNITIGGSESGIEVGFGDENEKGPDYRSVKDLYFADAVFIGDSRTVGMFEYGGLEEITTFYASKGLSVYDVFDKKIVEVSGQKKKITVEEALQQSSFSKIYLMLGLNEMGTGTTETFLAKYGEVLAHLQELQPDAIIYVQAIMKLTTERSGKGDQFHNEGIEERNRGLSQFADNEKIFFLDVNPLICDETGGMVEEYTYDGIHLKAKYIEIWKEFLKEHAIIP